MVVDETFSISYTTVTNFNCVTIEDFPEVVPLWKALVYQGEAFFLPILVETLLLKGGLYCKILFRGLFFLPIVAGGLYSSLYLYPLSCNAFWY